MSPKKTSLKLIPPEKYSELVKTVHFFDIVFKGGNWSVNPDVLGERNSIIVGFETERRDIDDNRVEFTQHYKLNVIPKNKKRPVVKIECDIVTQCYSDEKQSDIFWDTYERMTLPVITVPFFREHVHSLSGKMGIQPIVVPPWTR